jgi:hypothetical protein
MVGMGVTGGQSHTAAYYLHRGCSSLKNVAKASLPGTDTPFKCTMAGFTVNSCMGHVISGACSK